MGDMLELKQAAMRERLAKGRQEPVELPSSLVFERHFSVAEIAAMWRLSPDTVRELFEGEPSGVLVLGRKTSGRKRRYLTLRISESALQRVYTRLQNAA